MFQTFHISTFRVLVQLNVNITKLIANNNGKNRNADLYDQVMAATPVQPASIAFRLKWKSLDMDFAAGEIASIM